MALAHLNSRKSQIGDITNLAHLNDSGNLDNCLKIFLISCQVNNLSPRSISDYAQKIGRFTAFCRAQATTVPSDLGPTHIRLFLLEVQQRCQPVSVKDYYGCINRFFNWMVEEEIIKESPMARMRPPKVPKKIIKSFKTRDIDDLLTLCGNNFLGARNRAIILTFLDTGLRLAELAGIQLGDIDFDRGIIKVMGKGAKERLVRIGQETQKAILKYLLQRNDNLLCLWVTEERRPLQWGGIQVMIRRLGKRAGVNNVRCSPHTFRHTFGPAMIRHGVNMRTLQILLGHSTLTMTLRYVETVNSEDAIEMHKDFSPVDHYLK